MKHKILKYTVPQINVLSRLKIPSCNIFEGFLLNKSSLNTNRTSWRASGYLKRVEKVEYKAFQFYCNLKFSHNDKFIGPYKEISAYCCINPNGNTIAFMEQANLILEFNYEESYFLGPSLNLNSISHLIKEKLYDVSDIYLFNFIKKFGLQCHDSEIISKLVISYYNSKELTYELINEISKKIESLYQKAESYERLRSRNNFS